MWDILFVCLWLLMSEKLIKNSNMDSSKLDTLHSMGIFNLSYSTYSANRHIYHILRHRHVFLSAYLWADTLTANKVKKTKSCFINTFDLARVH